VRHVQGRPGGVDAGDPQAVPGEQQRERAGAAADVEHLARPALPRRPQVRQEVAAVGAERVLERGGPRMPETLVSHAVKVGGVADAGHRFFPAVPGLSPGR
jgi:hypothetical protein